MLTTLFPFYSVILIVLYCAITIGESNASVPNFAKAKIAAACLVKLIHTEPSINNLSEEGETLVGDTLLTGGEHSKIMDLSVIENKTYSKTGKIKNNNEKC